MGVVERVRRLAPRGVKDTAKRLLYGHEAFAPSFSTAGEDMVLRHLLGTEAGHGFYVDVGACEPCIGSNTYYFYGIGWRGINVEPQPEYFARLADKRPRDVNVNCAVGSEVGTKTLYVPDVQAAMGTLDADRGASWETKINVEVRTLTSILDQHLPPEVAIDFMSVDVEGRELDVLCSNDWERFRPRLMCIETEMSSAAVEDFVTGVGYRVVATNSLVIGGIGDVFAADESYDWDRTQEW